MQILIKVMMTLNYNRSLTDNHRPLFDQVNDDVSLTVVADPKRFGRQTMVTTTHNLYQILSPVKIIEIG